ncbi:MAG: DUF5915 domain-containing protein, partial [Bacteroidota bacterium]
VKKIKPNFKLLGKKYGKLMKEVSEAVGKFSQADISTIEKEGKFTLILTVGPVELLLEEVEIMSEDIPGWLVANDGVLTVALDITITEELKEEGIARELINRIQNIRKESGFEVTDKIRIKIHRHPEINVAVEHFSEHIGNQTLAVSVELTDDALPREVELDEELTVGIEIVRDGEG